MRKFRVIVPRKYELELIRIIASLPVHVSPGGGVEEPILSELERLVSKEELRIEDLERALTLLRTAAGKEDEYYRTAESIMRELMEVSRLERYLRKLAEIGIGLEQMREGRFIFLLVVPLRAEAVNRVSSMLRKAGVHVISVKVDDEDYLLIILGLTERKLRVIEVLARLGLRPLELPAWLGPSIHKGLRSIKDRKRALIQEFKNVVLYFVSRRRRGNGGEVQLYERYVRLRDTLSSLISKCENAISQLGIKDALRELGEAKNGWVECEVSWLERTLSEIESRVKELDAGINKLISEITQLRTLAKRLEAIEGEARLEELRSQLCKDIVSTYAEVVKVASRVAAMEDCVNAVLLARSVVRRLRVLRKYEYSIIEGWVPSEYSNDLKEAVKSRVPVLVLEVTPPSRQDRPPYLPRLKGLLQRMTSLTLTLDVPSYWELDPTLILITLFTIMYGMMFGDVGLGLTIIALGLIFKRWRAFGDFLGLSESGLESLSLLMVACGISSTIFGAVYGMAFLVRVYESLVSPIHDIGGMLGIALIFGVIQIILGMTVNVVNLLMAGDLYRAFLSGRGFLGLAFYFIGLVIAYALLSSGFNLSLLGAGVYKLLSYSELALLAGIMLAPLAKHFSEGLEVSECLIEGFMEVLETFIGLPANTLSYIRLAAFAIAHEAFGLLATALSPSMGLLPSLIVTNLLALVFESFAVGIQAARLTFYEFSTKFFRGGGVLFKPLGLELRERIRL